MREKLYAILTRAILLVTYGTALLILPLLPGIGGLLRPRARRAGAPHDVLILGTFYTRNWCRSHLLPLARAASVRRVFAVVDGPTEPIEGIEYVPLPRFLTRMFGRAVTKLLVATHVAVRHRPEIIMGYHLFPGALTGLLIARLTGARAAYQMTGGPVELIGGGALTENCLIRHLKTDAPVIERLVFALARRFDLIVVRGSSAREFMTARRLARRICIVPGSVDAARLAPDGELRAYDLVSMGRLVAVKQPEQVLEVVARVRQRRPSVRAIVLGDGPLLSELQEQARRLGIEGNVEFAGHVEDVERVLTRSKLFVLTSKSEGLSIAMAEAMVAGAVPVVADVGDLSDLVQNGATGWRIPPRALEDFAERIAVLLGDEAVLERISRTARQRAIEHNDVRSVAERWSRVIADVCGGSSKAKMAASPARSQAARRVAGRNHRNSKRTSTKDRVLAMLPSRRKAWELTPPPVKALLKPIAAWVPPERWLGRDFRSALALVSEAETWPAERAAAYQLEQLRHICTLAWQTPFYRRIYEDAGFEPGDLKSLDDFRRLPTIDAETVRAHDDEMLTLPPDAPGVDRVSTGGTSGRPLHFYIDAGRSAMEYAHLVCAWQRAGYQLHMPQAVIRGQLVAENASGLRHEYDPILRRHYYSNFHMTDENVRTYLEHIATLGPCCLHVYPSSAVALARFLERSGCKPPGNIEGILAGSENVYPQDRELVERVFGVRLLSWYGHTEKLVLAAECELSSHYHVLPTYGYCELLDEAGDLITTAGQRGEIVGTGFINTVMPFIRYRTGDEATFIGEGCPDCGREQPLIAEVRGHRTQEMLVASDGALISWTALNMHDDTFERVRQFQFWQAEAGRATLRIVPAEGFDGGDLQRIRRNLQRKLRGRLSFDIELTGEIPLTRMGKRTYVDQRLDLSTLSQDKEVAM